MDPSTSPQNFTDLLGPNVSLHTELGLPWAFEHFDEQKIQWRNKINSVIAYYLSQNNRCALELSEKTISPSTEKRIRHLQQSYSTAAEQLQQIFSPLIGTTTHMINTVFLERIPRQQTVMAYQQSFFRDWVWGQEELRQQMKALLPSMANSKKLLVLGGGSAGLPYVLHQELKLEETLVVDSNPILLKLAQMILFQEKNFHFFEFPKVPLSIADTAVNHLVKNVESPINFHLLVGDALRTNFRKLTFDTLLTPWLIDIVPSSFRRLCQIFNSPLTVGGRWLNIGLLAFEKNKFQDCPTQEELKDDLSLAGFEIEKLDVVQIPYMHSPHSMIRRNDQILIFSAVKTKHIAAPDQWNYLPDWLTNWQLPVPQNPEMVNLFVKSQVYAYTLNLVNGQNSMEQIAYKLSQQFQMNTDEARDAVYTFFVNIYEQFIYREFA